CAIEHVAADRGLGCADAVVAIFDRARGRAACAQRATARAGRLHGGTTPAGREIALETRDAAGDIGHRLSAIVDERAVNAAARFGDGARSAREVGRIAIEELARGDRRLVPLAALDHGRDLAADDLLQLRRRADAL